MLKRWITLAGLLLAITAVAGAASASAAEWTMGGKPLEKATEAEYDGQLAMATSVGTVQCEMGFRLEFLPKGGTVVKQFFVNFAKGCKVTGTWAKCTVTAAEAQQLGVAGWWEVDLEPPHFKITFVQIKFTFNAGCEAKESDRTWTISYGSITAAPLTQPFNNVSLSATGESNFGSVSILKEFEGKPSDTITEVAEATTMELIK